MSEPDFDWAVTNLGNASVLIHVDDAVVLTDPFFGRSRGISDPAALDPADLPELTAVVGSHWARSGRTAGMGGKRASTEAPLIITINHLWWPVPITV